MITFDSLIAESINFEVRYEEGYLYWDNTGKIFKEITTNSKEYGQPDVNILEAKISFPKDNLSVTFSPTLINIALNDSKDIRSLGKFSDSVINIITKALEIEVFSRIGNRFKFIMPSEDATEFSEIFKRAGILSVPEELQALIGTKVENQEVKFTLSKEDNFGVNIRFAWFAKRFSFQAPKGIIVDDKQFIKKGILFDIDIHTLKPVAVSTLTCEETIRRNMKAYETIISQTLTHRNSSQ